MTANTFLQPDYATQNGSTYKGAIDASIAVIARLGDDFSVHEQDLGSPSPDMTVRVNAGHILIGQTLSEVAAQTSATLTAPSANPRKDIVYIDGRTGVVGVATGAEAASPSDPAIPAGKIPLARVTLATSTTTITNSILTDIRDLRLLGVLSSLQRQDGVYVELVSGSPSGNDYVGTPAPAIAAYSDGMRFQVKFDAASTGPVQVDLGPGYVEVLKNDGATQLDADDVAAARTYEIVFNDSIGTGSPTPGAFVVPQLSTSAGNPTTLQTFTSSDTWTKPAGLAAARVTVFGAGGGGGTGTAGPNGGGGGGQGGMASKFFLADDLGATETVTIGAGGASATAGGTSSFGTLLSATGGAAGDDDGEGGGGGLGGEGSVTTGGLEIDGDPGDAGVSSSGRGGGSNGGAPTTSANGLAGTWGCGGSGGSGGGTTGGAGGNGFIIVEEFY